jgi:hypothetical protein
MRYRLGVLLLVATLAAPTWAQEWPDPPPAQSKGQPKAKTKRPPLDDVEELTPAQIQRAQERDPPGTAKERPQAVKRPPKGGGGAPARQVNCNGPFASDSSHIRLAQVFGASNVAFTEVDGPAKSKLMASVLFPKDAKRRLEVLWNNEGTRTGTQVIAINGQSAWIGPRGLRLGMPLPTLEKLNGKPFKLTGFGEAGSTVADWQGGALSSLPGGCKVGLRLIADRRATDEARKRVADAKELESNDAGVRAVRPTVSEILIGY